MTDGPDQARRKHILLDALDALDGPQAGALAAERARRATGWPDLQFGVPVDVVGTLLGLNDAARAGLPGLVGDFVRCIPGSATAEDQAAAAIAAGRLLALLDRCPADSGIAGLVRQGAGTGDLAALSANLVGLLSQTYDATAGLIGNTLLALTREPRPADLAAFVAEVARHDAPVQNTRRSVAAGTRIAGHDVPAGAEILVLLAAANRDPAANPDPHAFRADRSAPRMFTFGAAAHGCPGRDLAIAITTGVVRTVSARPALAGYRPSPNARIPVLEGRLS
jgi:cytochrome P450